MAWDSVNTRDSSTSTYCTYASRYGCNAWASTLNILGKPSVFTLHYPNGNSIIDTESYSGSVTVDSSLNTFLNGTYLERLKADSKYIETHIFNIGTPGNHTDTEDIALDITQEALYKWKGKIGLMNVTDVLKTTIETSCTSLSVGYNNGSKSVCSNNNWMWIQSGYEWTISPNVRSDRINVWNVYSGGYIQHGNAYDSARKVRPVVYINSNIQLLGEGTNSKPYTIIL